MALLLILPSAGNALAAADKGSDTPKKEYTEAEFDADSTACRVEAQIRIFGPDGNGKREVTVAQTIERDGIYKVTRDLITACMKKRGYPAGE